MKNTIVHTLCVFSFIMSIMPLCAADLELEQKDLAVIQDPAGAGYHFYIRKKPDVASVLITETTKDPENRLDNFAYRSPNYNSINGDEKRILNGKEHSNNSKNLYSLVDSTPEKDTPIGEAFHIWVPYIIVYGYEWSRHGEVQVLDGTFFNIRTFEKPYADYDGSFIDNPFVLRVTQKAVDNADKGSYSDLAVQSFSQLARLSGNKLIYADTVDTIVPAIEVVLRPNKKKHIDVAFVIDATESMKDDIDKIRASVERSLEQTLKQYDSARIALVLYKDYNDDFTVKTACGLTEDIAHFMTILHDVKVFGGRDIPEAVYEGLHEALQLDWATDKNTDKRLILIGDAPPHPRPQGKITQAIVMEEAQHQEVRISSIILPHRLAY